ncbi:pyridoxamine 5'-phosphate oxidase [Rhodococcus aerolatus]
MADPSPARADGAPDLADMRVAYEPGSVGLAELVEETLAPTWHEQLGRWLAEATDAGVVEPNAMVLATADTSGRASSRTVLCKGLDERGVVFYSNHTSAKGHQLRDTHWASATFPWYPLQRQVHVRGVADRIGAEETEQYWRTRPRGSQLGAWASVQSAVVPGRRQLEDALELVTRRYADVEQVPVPPHWGGTRIRPQSVEFWQGRQSRLHDRLRYQLDAATRTWSVVRLQP